MKKLEKYILKELMLTTALVVSVLIASLWIIQSLKFVGIFLKSSEGFFAFLSLIFLSLPDLLVLIVPIGIFISVLIVYNRFHTDRELSVMFSSGYGIWKIARPALTLSLAITVFIYALNIFILPLSFKKMRDMEGQLKSSLPSIFVQEGVFSSFSDIMIYVNKKRGTSLEGIIAHVHKEKENPYTIAAKRGELIIENRIPKIFMVDGTRQEKDLKTNEISILYFDKTIISLVEEEKKHNQARPRKPYELSIRELISSDNISLPHGQRLYAEGYQRLLNPLYSIAFTCIALCFLLRANFRRRGQFFSILQAVLVVLFLQSGCISLMNWGSKTWYAIVAAYILMITTILVCLVIIRGSHKKEELR
jgi:lipopolysaccharide export system permease protein